MAGLDIALLLQYALGVVLLLAVPCMIVSFFIMMRSIMGFATGLGGPAGKKTDSERAARMFDSPAYAAERKRLGLSALVFLCCFAILFTFTLIKKQLA